jgi:ubiquinone/menaquinone biosynthesis C-methylase UbiE
LVQALMLGRARQFRQSIADIMPVQPGDAILDVGCGTGDLDFVLGQRQGGDATIVGIDASPKMIAWAQRKARRWRFPVEFRVAAAEALPFEAHSFDHVVCCLVLHHLPGDLKRKAVASMAHVLKSGGYLTIVDFLNAEGYVQTHAAAATDNETLPNWLHGAGIEIVNAGALRVRSLGALLGWPPVTFVQGRLITAEGR